MKKNRVIKIIISFFAAMVIIMNSSTTVFAGPTLINTEQQDTETAIAKGFDYLMTQINPDGGIRWVDENSSMAASIRTVQALAAGGYTQSFLAGEAGNRPIDYIAKNANAWVNQAESENPGFSVARAGQLLTAIAAANENPHQFGPEGLNLVREIKLRYEPSSGIYGASTPDNVLNQVWGMIGLAANNASIPEEASAWLVSTQAEDGSWNDGFGSILDTTPMGVMALLSSSWHEAESSPVQSAVDFMAANQQPAGGWQNEWDTMTNANTTGNMVQAIALLGQNPADGIWQKPNGNPISALLEIQDENGAFGGEFANAFSTADVIIALSGRSITDLGSLEIASDAFDFVFAAQETNGGWGSVGQTLDTLLALRAAGWQPNTAVTDQNTPLDFVAGDLEAYLESGPDAIGKSILGLITAGEDPTDFNNIDLVQHLQNAYDAEVGAFGSPENTWHQALAILGLHAAGAEMPEGAVDTLINLQQEDGGWEYTPGFGTWPDNTALAIQALLAAGYTPQDTPIVKAVEYLRVMQNPDGGWGDSSTTAYVLMVLNALELSWEDWVTDMGKEPVSNLLSYQKANGAFVYNWEFTDDNLMSTVTALLALFGGDYLIEGNLDVHGPQAAIIVDPGEGTRYADCVTFDGESINGLELLERSGFTYSIEEGFLSSIMDVANLEGETNYWSYWSWDGRAWAFKNSSAGDSTVVPGTIEAWYFTSWEIFPSFPPDFIPDINQICPSEGLKTYSNQPHLDYNDLFDVSLEDVEPPRIPQENDLIKSTTTPEGSQETLEPTTLTEPTSVADEGETQSPLPLFIIAVVGGLGLMVILVILLKKRQ